MEEGRRGILSSVNVGRASVISSSGVLSFLFLIKGDTPCCSKYSTVFTCPPNLSKSNNYVKLHLSICVYL
jgi:hypothetical protein